MSKKLTIPGPGGLREIDVREPSIEHQQLMSGLQNIFMQLKQTTMVLNTIAGQLDLTLRVNVQAIDKKEVKRMFAETDARVDAERAAYAERAAETREDDPALD